MYFFVFYAKTQWTSAVNKGCAGSQFSNKQTALPGKHMLFPPWHWEIMELEYMGRESRRNFLQEEVSLYLLIARVLLKDNLKSLKWSNSNLKPQRHSHRSEGWVVEDPLLTVQVHGMLPAAAPRQWALWTRRRRRRRKDTPHPQPHLSTAPQELSLAVRSQRDPWLELSIGTVPP